MADSSLQDRLRGHAKAFDGLLSLIPAKMYYGEDNSDQWNRKKQTKEEAAAARRGKLDPDSELNRNAKEVMDERAKNKRKLRDMEEDNAKDDEWEDYEPAAGVDAEKPGEGMKVKTETSKKQKLEGDNDEKADESAATPKMSKKDEKRAAKREKKKEKKDKQDKEDKPTEKKSHKAEDQSLKDTDASTAAASAATPAASTPKAKKNAAKKQAKNAAPSASKAEQDDSSNTKSEMRPIDVTGLDKDTDMSGTSGPESEPLSPTFDTADASATSEAAEPSSTTTSVSSTTTTSEKPKHIKIPADTSALRARLAAKIEALRAARKADGPDGKPIRTRQELIESRRRKQELRKAHKQETRKQARLDEQQKREEALASSSPGVMSPRVEVDEATGNFSFGRVAFGDGAKLSHDLSYVLSQGKRKGPSDVKTALIKVQNQKKRLENLNEEKRNDIEEKESWLNARRRVEGEKIRDDEALLKRAVKRKEITKRKSEKAWKDRSEGVKMAQKERQRKREDNLRARREDKMLGKAGKKKKKGGATKKKGRPGFEGSLGVGGRKK